MLRWWWDKLAEDNGPGVNQEWMKALEDVYWVIEQVITLLQYVLSLHVSYFHSQTPRSKPLKSDVDTPPVKTPRMAAKPVAKRKWILSLVLFSASYTLNSQTQMFGPRRNKSTSLECSGLAALDQANTKFNQGYATTGAALSVCGRHEIVQPKGVVDLLSSRFSSRCNSSHYMRCLYNHGVVADMAPNVHY